MGSRGQNHYFTLIIVHLLGLGKGLFSLKYLVTRHLKNIKVVSRENDGKCLLCRQMIVFDIYGVVLF